MDAPISPTRKATRQPASARVIAPRIPLIPATRPRESQSQEADSPIRAPPMVAETGVNWVMNAAPCGATHHAIPQGQYSA